MGYQKDRVSQGGFKSHPSILVIDVDFGPDQSLGGLTQLYLGPLN